MIHGGALGDFVMSLRLVEALRRSGASHVAVLGKPALAELARACGNVDEVRDLETGHYHRLFARNAALPDDATAWLRQFNLAINTLTDRDQIVAGNLRQSGIRQVIDIDPRPRDDWTGHITDQWLHELASSGLSTHVNPPRLTMPAAIRRDGEALLRRHLPDENPIPVIIHPGSGGRSKCWPINCFVDLIYSLGKCGFSPLVVLGPAELEGVTRTGISAIRNASPTIESPSLPELAGLIAAAQHYVGNDSGVSHIAAAVGAKTVAIFGPTDPNRWRPLGDSVRVVCGEKKGALPGTVKVLSEIIALA